MGDTLPTNPVLSTTPGHKTRIPNWILFTLGATGLIAYIILSFVAINWYRNRNNPAVTVPTTVQQNNAPALIPSSGKTSTSSMPTPTPNLGPGKYACSFEGVCNLYGDKERTNYCKDKKTFADPTCLGQCDKQEYRCTR